MQFQFYHLLSTPLESALPKLLEKALAGGYRALVLTESETQAERLNQWLWSYDPDSFLPHGTAKDGDAAHQPVYLTTKMENPNGAAVLVVTDGSQCDEPAGFERVLDIFDGNDPEATVSARSRWKYYKDAGHDLSYIKQNASGGWDKMEI